MLTAWLNGPTDITTVDVAEPVIIDLTDVIVDITYSAICGSDLWVYRGLVPKSPGSTGHEFMGRVREVGSAVTQFKPGDSVIAPFAFSEGSCYECTHGLQPLCADSGLWGKDGPGAQAERIRVVHADATLVALPWNTEDIDLDLARKLIPLADVYATGMHGALLAGVSEGDTVAVVGDGAVGISAAVAALRLGAERVVVLGEQEGRLSIAKGFGAETLKVDRSEPGAEVFRALNDGVLADKVVECVGMQAAFDTALSLVRPGGSMGFVGVPHGVQSIAPMKIFGNAIHLAGGVAPARQYLPSLINDVAEGLLDPSPLIDRSYELKDVAQGYGDMQSGEALKVVLEIG